MALRADLEVVRDTLEEALSPAVATALIFDALDAWDSALPEDRAQIEALVAGPLAAVLATRLGAHEAHTLLSAIAVKLANGDANEPGDLELDIDLDLDLGDEEGGMPTTQMMAVEHPVAVLVVSANEAFAARLLLAVGATRVYTYTVSDEAAFRHATFSTNPLIVVVDSVSPAAIRPPDLAAALRGLPTATLAVVWGEDTDFGRETRVRIDQSGTNAMYLALGEGIEPLLDLVLSRFKG